MVGGCAEAPRLRRERLAIVERKESIGFMVASVENADGQRKGRGRVKLCQPPALLDQCLPQPHDFALGLAADLAAGLTTGGFALSAVFLAMGTSFNDA